MNSEMKETEAYMRNKFLSMRYSKLPSYTLWNPEDINGYISSADWWFDVRTEWNHIDITTQETEQYKNVYRYANRYYQSYQYINHDPTDPKTNSSALEFSDI